MPYIQVNEPGIFKFLQNLEHYKAYSKNLSERYFSGEAQYRVKWRRLIRNMDPYIKARNDAEE